VNIFRKQKGATDISVAPFCYDSCLLVIALDSLSGDLGEPLGCPSILEILLAYLFA